MNTEELADLVQLIRLLDEFFDSDDLKVSVWLSTKNPHLGESKPIDLFLKGRGHKVLAFARNAIDENKGLEEQ